MKVLMKKRVSKIILILVLCGVGALLLSNAFKPDQALMSEYQIVTAQWGDLTIDITSSGNLELSHKEDLAFEMAGTVEEILVEEGESVAEGQVLATLDTSEWEKELTTLQLNLLQAEINLENAKYALDKAEERTTITTTGNVVVNESYDPWEVDIKEMQVELAEARFEDAKEALEEALEKSPEIIAPFDGFITKVNVEGGDEVLTGMVAVELADPNKFEADILVSEMDILQVKLGGEATVQVDAMPVVVLPAKVTHISPTATIQAGVVNYEVKVEVASLEEMIQQQQEARQEAMEKIAQGELPEELKEAVEEGQITQEQAEEMMKQRQLEEAQQRQMPTMIPEDFQLREGLTVTVSIIVEEKDDVLLLPNAAIIRQGGSTYVQVMSPNGVIEERSITTGISNWQYTEVIDGLSEGEQVVVPQGVTTTSTTARQGMMPGMGRVLH